MTCTSPGPVPDTTRFSVLQAAIRAGPTVPVLVVCSVPWYRRTCRLSMFSTEPRSMVAVMVLKSEPAIVKP